MAVALHLTILLDFSGSEEIFYQDPTFGASNNEILFFFKTKKEKLGVRPLFPVPFFPFSQFPKNTLLM